MNNLIIHLHNGPLEIMDLKTFVAKIPLEQVNNYRITIPKIVSFNMSLDLISTPEIQAINVELFQFGRIDSEFIRRSTKIDLEEQIKLYCKQGILSQFNSLIAGKDPALVIKDNNMECIYDLSSKSMMNFGNATCGIEHCLSKFQTFFILANPEDFKFFYMLSPSSNDSQILLGKLVDMESNRWVMARYQNNNLREELNSQMLYYVSKK